ncbi:MAG: LLM class flavin-dependent oxidoreductase, partial [Nitrospinota bacterium]
MIQFGLMFRSQFPPGDDMQARLAELLEQARAAQRCGFDSLCKGQHYLSSPFQEFQQLPFLARLAAEA